MTLKALLKKTVVTANQHVALADALKTALKERYGITPNDADCEPAIVAIDFGGNPNMTLAELDEAMKTLGFPPKKPQKGKK